MTAWANITIHPSFRRPTARCTPPTASSRRLLPSRRMPRDDCRASPSSTRISTSPGFERRWSDPADPAATRSWRGMSALSPEPATRRAPLPGMGCMRLSTDRGRNEADAVAVLHAAFDAGITFFDTADAYCLEAGEAGHDGGSWRTPSARGPAIDPRRGRDEGRPHAAAGQLGGGRARPPTRVGVRGQPPRSEWSASTSISSTRSIRARRSRPACARWRRCSVTG